MMEEYEKVMGFKPVPKLFSLNPSSIVQTGNYKRSVDGLDNDFLKKYQVSKWYP